jgi:hypothetical protein
LFKQYGSNSEKVELESSKAQLIEKQRKVDEALLENQRLLMQI